MRNRSISDDITPVFSGFDTKAAVKSIQQVGLNKFRVYKAEMYNLNVFLMRQPKMVQLF